MLWIIVPTYNEVENIGGLVAGLFALSLPLQVLIVDDASTDGTAKLVDGLAGRNPNLHVLHRAAKLGLGSAYRDGFAYALQHGAEVVGEMDADLSHAPEDVPRLYAALAAGAQVVIGSRRMPGGKIVGWGPWRHLASWGAMAVSRLTLGLKTKDVTAGFRLYTKDALASIPWQNTHSDGYAWQEEILFWCERAKLRIVEVPVTFVDRQQGKSKLSPKNATEFFITMWRLQRGRWYKKKPNADLPH